MSIKITYNLLVPRTLSKLAALKLTLGNNTGAAPRANSRVDTTGKKGEWGRKGNRERGKKEERERKGKEKGKGWGGGGRIHLWRSPRKWTLRTMPTTVCGNTSRAFFVCRYLYPPSYEAGME